MTLANAIPENKKMSVIFRVEPGSLGPNGNEYIKDFCDFAQQQLRACSSDHILWFIEPRLDKKLVEMEFQISAKILPRNKVNQYLKIFGDNLEHFEDQLEDHIEAIINQYFGR